MTRPVNTLVQNGGMEAELARLSRTIDPAVLGQRIRSARLAAGKTQAELAGSVVSAAYISRIEMGSRRPDVALIQHVAESLGTSPEALVLGVGRDQLIEAELALTHAELSLRLGDPVSALGQLDVVLRDEGLSHVALLTERAETLRARALEAAGRFADAIAQLEQVVSRTPRDARWLRSLTSLSRCYRETGELGRAVEMGQTALAEIEPLGLSGTDEAIQLALTVAAARYELGDVTQALDLCRRTVDEAERVASPTARASAYWNANLMQARQGAVAGAVELARKAIGILEGGEDARNLARLRGALAAIQLRLDPPDLESAAACAREALGDMEWCDASTLDKARVRLTLAKIDYLSGREDGALEGATECLEATRESAPLLAAEACVVLGRVQLVRDERGEARGAFQRAIMMLTAIGADRKAAEMWFELGALMLQLGDQEAALDAYRRAGASSGLIVPTGLGLPAVEPT
jgi:tetratricopeptide (TPR) repeat protein